jgi:hypothetical protein
MDMIDPFIAEFIMGSGRSWWIVQYRDGCIRREWEEHPGGNRIALPRPEYSSVSEWENIPKKGIIGAYLFCPNGQAAAIEQPEDGKIFQFKVGHINVVGETSAWCSAHILGVVINANGDCQCVAWEPGRQNLTGFQDNVYDFKYQSIGRLAIINSLELKV